MRRLLTQLGRGFLLTACTATALAANAGEWDQQGAAAVATTLADEAQDPSLSAIAEAATAAAEAPGAAPSAPPSAALAIPNAIMQALGEDAPELLAQASAVSDPNAAQEVALEQQGERAKILAEVEGKVNELVFSTAAVAGELQAGSGAEATYESFHLMVGSADRLRAQLESLGVESSPEHRARFQNALHALGTFYSSEAIRLGLDLLPDGELIPMREEE